MLLYLGSVVLTALIEIGIILIVGGDKYSKIHEILMDEKRTAGLILILIGVNLMPIVNLAVMFMLLIMWGDDLL